jgi:alpha-amylase/alpha-mannosidase (GH57 family)
MKKLQLPVIRLINVRPTESVELDLQMDDDIYEILAKEGLKEIAEDKQALFEYAFKKGLARSLEAPQPVKRRKRR